MYVNVMYVNLHFVINASGLARTSLFFNTHARYCPFDCGVCHHPGSWVSIRASLSWTSFARNYWISDLIFQVLILNFKEHASWLFESPYFNLHIHWSILILAKIAELSVLDILFLFQQGRGPIFGLLFLSVNLLGTIENVGTDHCHCWLIC